MKTKLTLTLVLGTLLSHAQVSVKSFGAKGDGVTNDAVAIQKALNSGNTQIYFEAGKTYMTSSVLFVPSNVTVTGNGATLKPNSSFSTAYDDHPVIGTYSKPVTFEQSSISISVKKGVSTFTYAKASSLKVGAIVLLAGPTYVTYGSDYYKYGWYASVTAISGTTVTLSTPSTNTYTATSIRQYVTSKNIHIKGVNVNLKGRKTGTGISLAHTIGSSIESCFVESDPTSTSAPVGIGASGLNITVSKNKVRNIRLGSGVGYGINVSGHNITVSENDVAVARHCITSAQRNYMATNINFLNNVVNNGAGGAPLDFHGNTSGKIDGNTVYSTTPNITSIMVRNSNTVVSNNTITVNNASGTRVYGITMDENGYENITISKNKVYFKGTSGGACAVSDFGVVGVLKNIFITRNYFQAGVTFTDELGTGIHIDSNTFEGNNIYNPVISFSNNIVKEFYIDGNTFINNYDSRFNYVLSTTNYNGAIGYIRNNTVRVNNPKNLSALFRINNVKNVLENNVFYTQYKYPMIDYTTAKENWINKSKMVNNVPVSTVITYKEIPKATAWFVGKIISYTDSAGKTTQYKCVKTSTSTYTWQKQSTTVTT